MKQNIIHIGLDVDDAPYHGSAFNKETGEVIDFKCRPTLKGLLQQLDRMERHFKGHKIKLCYEASYIGYCLQRDLISNDIHCDIVSPSSIPSPRGKAIKTDRIDAGYLVNRDSSHSPDSGSNALRNVSAIRLRTTPAKKAANVWQVLLLRYSHPGAPALHFPRCHLQAFQSKYPTPR